MISMRADALSAILDKVAPHRPTGDGMEHLDVIVLDCTRRWLHAAAGGDRTLAVARTPVTGSHWTAPIAFQDATALREWLESSDHITVEHLLERGGPLLRFTEGAAQLTVPVATSMAELPWRNLLRLEAPPSYHTTEPVRLGTADLALWENAGEEVDVRPGAGLAALVVTAGRDFIGVQMPRPGTPGGDPLLGWAASIRSRCFLYEGLPFEVGARYLDHWGAVWWVAARPAPGEEPLVVSVDRPGTVLPLEVVLKAGGPLLRLPA
ncbi:hypothetical protein [Streptomyces sp. CB03238]|uniref:hypothetical protein n=1 Tax=Streptomyces sp. CB03238 TaxID=1907777 RepID=UPI000A121A77|nr:hypothetical protein [Streptomyces sp. CB03238]ORT54284.1 hypothetical protein BKD26_35800 [Streptomyces sp. CB03238]